MNTNVQRFLTLITAKDAENAKITVTTNSKRTQSSYEFITVSLKDTQPVNATFKVGVAA